MRIALYKCFVLILSIGTFKTAAYVTIEKGSDGSFKVVSNGNTFHVVHERYSSYGGGGWRFRVLESPNKDEGTLYYQLFMHDSQIESVHLSRVNGIKSRPGENHLRGAGQALRAAFLATFHQAPKITSILVDSNEAELKKVLRENPYPSLERLSATVPALKFAGWDYELGVKDNIISLTYYPRQDHQSTLVRANAFFNSKAYQTYLESEVGLTKVPAARPATSVRTSKAISIVLGPGCSIALKAISYE